MTPAGRAAVQQLLAVVAAGVLAGCTGSAGPVGAPAPPAASPRAPASTAPATPVPATPPTAPTPGPVATGGAARAPRVTGALNFRDVAGWKVPLALAGGASMAPGVVYRSGRLKDLTGADRRELEQAGVTDIIDLRTTEVARRTPDPVIKGARYRHINLFGVYSTGTARYDTAAEAVADRERLNRRFVSDAGQRERTASVLEVIAKAKGPVIIHCSEGKDRTGWISAVLQLTAGASTDDVMAEYLLSNRFREDAIDARYAKVLKARGKRAADVDRLLATVDAPYLQAALDELGERYGDIDTFLTEGLGLTPPTVTALRARLRGE